MATIPLYDASIGVANHSLHTLRDLLQKAQAHPDAASMPSLRLAPDMHPLTAQVQYVSNFSKKMVERLAGRTVDAWEDNEETMEQLFARIDKTIDLLKTVKREDVDAIQGKTLPLKVGPYDGIVATVPQYVLGFALPNMMFHLSIAYGLLRMKGLEIGKADLLKNFMHDFFALPPKDSAPAQ